MAELGLDPRDLEFVLLSHGHEDHDGSLGEVTARTGAAVRAHTTYERLVRKYPDLAPAEYKRDFPAKCWHCFMPESFYARNCLAYHAELLEIPVETIGDGLQSLGPDMRTLHVPGHSPDCLALLLGDEVLLVGDSILPGITPWPTSLNMHRVTGCVLGDYPEPEKLYGLKRYIKSLKELAALAGPGPAVLPAHRLFHLGQLQPMETTARVDELLAHHVDRCADILRILAQGPQDVEGHRPRALRAGEAQGRGNHDGQERDRLPLRDAHGSGRRGPDRRPPLPGHRRAGVRGFHSGGCEGYCCIYPGASCPGQFSPSAKTWFCLGSRALARPGGPSWPACGNNLSPIHLYAFLLGRGAWGETLFFGLPKKRGFPPVLPFLKLLVMSELGYFAAFGG